ncbi:hypothetical protein LOZ57_006861 [Ophidiomyces ophidiicola]|uniref:uncharacterized protein n=1 Tax=Ophidiomyces ophidiicola TaxID=1387563 RepID=UPI0020C3E8E7|nr:uncharacterized protein LOZ57_006861 [Ophidiomyces ophidiicola]KAI1935872.1 hypothetical protein LOZ57_006861 [Ophidiomyces ophidiicola]KAI2042970.1 hypothetical protein LOZ43_006708 [Ophidiomyces ophidiicola]
MGNLETEFYQSLLTNSSAKNSQDSNHAPQSSGISQLLLKSQSVSQPQFSDSSQIAVVPHEPDNNHSSEELNVKMLELPSAANSSEKYDWAHTLSNPSVSFNIPHTEIGFCH